MHAIHEVQERLDGLELRDGGADPHNPHNVRNSGAAEGDMAVVREELHRQAGYMRNLESTNTRLEAELRILRQRNESVEVLRDEKRWLEKRLHNFEEMRTRVVALEAEVDAGRKEREDW